MTKLRWTILAVTVGCLALVAFVPSWRTIVVGYVRGEQTYRGKPTSYWARTLTERGEAGDHGAMAVLQGGGAAAVPVLIEALGNQDAQVRLNAAAVLGAIGKDAMPSLIHALSHHDAIVRIGAARAFTKMRGAGDAVPALHSTLDDAEPIVVTMALTALGKTGTPTVPILIEFFQSSKNVRHRLVALDALVEIGPDAKAAVPVLLKAAKEEDDPIAEKAGEALKKIDPASATEAGID